MMWAQVGSARGKTYYFNKVGGLASSASIKWRGVFNGVLAIVLGIALAASFAIFPVQRAYAGDLQATNAANTILSSQAAKNPEIVGNLTLQKGAKKTLKIDKVKDKNKVWRSTNSSVVSVKTVKGNGVVTAKKAGKATVYVVSKTTKKRYGMNITVTDPKINKTKLMLSAGKTAKLKVRNTGGETVKWVSSNRRVATVNSKGAVKGIKAGKATITAKIGAKKLKCVITVLPKKLLSADKTNVVLERIVGYTDNYPTARVIVKFALAGEYSVKCSTSNANVEASWVGIWSGKVRALELRGMRPGTSKVVISNSYNDEKLTINVTVKSKRVLSVDRTNIVLEPTTRLLADGGHVVDGYGTAAVKVQFPLGEGYTVKWASSSSCVKPSWTREWDGDVTTLELKGVRSGTSKVTLSNSYNGEKVTINVTVKPAFGVKVEPAYKTVSSLATDSDGYYITEYYLPIYVKNNTDSTVKLDKGAMLYLPDINDSNNTGSLMLFTKTNHRTGILGGSNYASLYAITEDLITKNHSVFITPGEEATMYAYFGTSDKTLPSACGLFGRLTVGGTEYSFQSDYWGDVTYWAVNED